MVNRLSKFLKFMKRISLNIATVTPLLCTALLVSATTYCLADVATWFSGTRTAVVDSNFRLTTSLDQGRLTEFLNSGGNAFVSGSAGGLSFHVLGSDNKWYYSANSPANTTGFRIHEAGKNYAR